MTDTYDYDAFGSLIHQAGSTPNSYLYTGEQFDPALGFYYLRARYMNPESGRFWSMDEFQGYYDDPQSLHRYTYAANNPVTNSDPTGYETLVNIQFSQRMMVTIAAMTVLLATAPLLNNPRFGRRPRPDLRLVPDPAPPPTPEPIPLPFPEPPDDIRAPKILYYYRPAEEIPMIVASGYIRASTQTGPGGNAAFGPGVYLTDLAPYEIPPASMHQFVRALWMNPFFFGGNQRPFMYIAIDVNGTGVQREGPLHSRTFGAKYIYRVPTFTGLSLVGRIKDVGPVKFGP